MQYSFDLVDTLKDVKIITPFYINDNRGSFQKIFETTIYNRNLLNFKVSEVFLSISQKDVIRGLHFQYDEPQTKLVTVLRGACLDVIVDLRENSESYLNYKFFELNEDTHRIIYIPKGYAHGFLSLTDNMEMLYICDGNYNKETDTGILFNDKTIGIKWPVDNISKTIHSERDLNLMTFDEFKKLNIFKEL